LIHEFSLNSHCSLALGGGTLAVPLKIKRVGNVSSADFDEDNGSARVHWYSSLICVSHPLHALLLLSTKIRQF
jgi:hypothetical protein